MVYKNTLDIKRQKLDADGLWQLFSGDGMMPPSFSPFLCRRLVYPADDFCDGGVHSLGHCDEGAGCLTDMRCAFAYVTAMLLFTEEVIY